MDQKRRGKRLLALGLAVVMTVSSGSMPGGTVKARETEEKSPMRIWFDEPVSGGQTILSGGAFATTEEDNQWQQLTLPIGNSFMGANVYGEVSKEHLTFNHKTLWNGGPSLLRPDYNGGNIEADSQGQPMSEIFHQINELFLEGKDGEASALCEKLVGDSDYGAYQSWGDIYLEFAGIPEDKVSGYSRDLDLETAVANVDFQAGETKYHREYFISYKHNVLAMKLTAEGGETMNFNVRFPVDNGEQVTQRNLGKDAAYTLTEDAIVMQGELQDNQLKMNSMLKVIPVDGSVEKNGDGESLDVQNTREAVIFVAADTDYANVYPDYRSGETQEELAGRVVQRVEQAAADSYEAVKKAHVEDYRDIYSRVKLDLGQGDSEKTTDELLKAYNSGTASSEERAQLEVLLYQYGRFLTIESSRQGDLPSNLQGVWQNRVGDDDRVPWASDYHFNVNVQMNYWPTYSANMAECAEPFIDYVNSLREPGRVTAATYFGIPSGQGEENGFTVHTANNPFGWTAPGWEFSWGWSPAALPWALQNCWEYFEYTGDMEYMEQNIYPMLKEEAKMYAGLLIDSKIPITLEDGSRSTRLVSSPAYSPEHGPRTLGNVYEQSLIWQLFEDAVQAMKLLNKPEDEALIEELVQKQSRLAPIEVGDSGQIKEWYHETTLGSVGSRGHRHMSHLLGLFPGDLISVNNDEYMDAALVSLKERGMESTGWGMGQRINAWARTGDGEKAYQLINTLFASEIYPNLWDSHPPFQIDGNFGYTSGINEMLMQSNTGYINLLPAIPDAWSSGSVEGIVARGNFEIDIFWNEGKAEEANIRARSGGACTLQYPGISQAVLLDGSGNPVERQVLGRDKIRFESETGESYAITEFPRIPEGPKNVSACYLGKNQMELSWESAQEGISNYNIYRKNAGSYEKINERPVTGNTYLDMVAVADPSKVKYKIAGILEDGSESLYSQPAKVTDLTARGMIDDGSERVVYSPGWKVWSENTHYGGGIHYKESTGPEDTIELTFSGTGIRVYASRNRDRGMMDVYLDNEKTDCIDFYVDGDQKKQIVFEKEGLEDGKHTILLRGTGEKNAASRGTKIEFDAFEVLGGPEASEDIVYTKDYEDGVTGDWRGADAAVIEDPDQPGNHVLELKNTAKGTAGRHMANDASAPGIADGTFSARVKVLSKSDTYFREGFVYRVEDADAGEGNQLVESGGWFICNEGSHATGYPKYTALEEKGGIRTNVWNDIKIQFSGEEVEISVNGTRYGKVSIAGQSTAAGTYGIRNMAGDTFLLDDVVFTTEMLDMGKEEEEPNEEDDRVRFAEDYSRDTPSWSEAGTVSEGIFSIPVRAGGIAVNENSRELVNGFYTWQITTDGDGKLGVAVNIRENGSANIFYTDGRGTFYLKGSGEEIIARDSLRLEANTSYQIKLYQAGKVYKLYVDGALVAEGESEYLMEQSGKSGLYQPGNKDETVRVSVHEGYEIFCYFNDYSDPDKLGQWTNADTEQTEDGQLKLTISAVNNAVAIDTPRIANGIFEFDVTHNPSSALGRLGFLFRSEDNNNYQGVFYDVSKNWFWLKNSSYGAYQANCQIENGKPYHIRMEVEGPKVLLYINGEQVGGGSYGMTEKKGYFGIRKQFMNAEVLLDNLKIQETVKVDVLEKPDRPAVIQSRDMKVTMDQNFPRVLGYQSGQKTLPGNPKKTYNVSLNGITCTPVVTCTKKGEDTLEYELKTLNAKIRLQYKVNGTTLDMNILSIDEKEGYVIRDIQFDNQALVSTSPGDTSASYATVETNGGWYEVRDHIYDTMDQVTEQDLGQAGRGYGMLSSGGLAATIRNSSIEAANVLNTEIYKVENGFAGSLGDGVLTYRTPLDVQEGTSSLPWSKVVICEDYNGDGSVNWKDAAANYKNVRKEILGMESIKDNMMYIAMNFGSQVQEPFLKSLDTGKIVYNLTDGFGQMVMEKGYAAEGHDDSHGDYGGHIGVRQGGKEDFNKVIRAGKKYNMKYGIHINVSEHNPDGLLFNPDVMTRPLSANWGWLDQAYWVDETQDILSGNRAKNLDALKEDLPDLNFVYVDIYGNSTWKADNLVRELNDRGYLVGTEFGGAMEQGASFTHWGHDNSYPNHGNNSTILKYFKNDLDVFVSDAMFNGAMMPRVGSWGGKNDINEAQEDFFNHNLPTKYMQHFDVLNIGEDFVDYTGKVRVEKAGNGVKGEEENLVTMYKDGEMIASWEWWKEQPEDESWADDKTGEATVFIPWYGEDSSERNPDEAAKIYHWNPKGGSTEWKAPKAWKDVKEADVYKLTVDCKEKVGTVPVTDGKITVNAEPKTGYVLYPAGSPAPVTAGDFGEGSHLKNPGFGTFNLKDWEITKNQGKAEVVQAENLETYLELTGDKGVEVTVSQTMTGLTPDKAATVYLFTQMGKDTELKLQVKAGDQTYTKLAKPTSRTYYGQSKFTGKNYQKVRLTFDVPEKVTEAKLSITGKMNADGGRIALDDVNVWENISRTPTAGEGAYEDYILYEDFENVEQGYGAFQLAYPSEIYTHLAEYRDGAGQFTDYVLNGNFSLKTNETGRIGEILRSEEEVKLKGNTAYVMEFTYETGIADAYRISVKSQSKGDAFSEMLSATQLNQSGRHVKASFVTGDADDYYVSVETLTDIKKAPAAVEKPEGSAMEYIYLSLDDVMIYEDHADKSLLEKLVKEIQGMDLNGYTKDSVKALKDALKDAEAVLADTGLTQKDQQKVEDAAEKLRACKEALEKEGAPAPGEVKVTEVRLNKASLLMQKGDSEILRAEVRPANAANKSIVWTSDNPSAVRVEVNGRITAVGYGTARITAAAKDGSKKTDVCSVTVGYSIRYRLNKGRNNQSNPSIYYREQVNLKAPVRKGYAFEGWYTSSRFKKATRVKSIPQNADRNYTLYAKWTRSKTGKVASLTVKNTKTRTLKLSWKKVKGAKGYEVLYSADRKFRKKVTRKTVFRSKFIEKRLKKGRTYYVKVRAYKVDSAKKKVYGAYSKTKSVKIVK